MYPGGYGGIVCRRQRHQPLLPHTQAFRPAPASLRHGSHRPTPEPSPDLPCPGPHRYLPDVVLEAAGGHDGTIFCSEGSCKLNADGTVAGIGVVWRNLRSRPQHGRSPGPHQPAETAVARATPTTYYYRIAATQSQTNCVASNLPHARRRHLRVSRYHHRQPQHPKQRLADYDPRRLERRPRLRSRRRPWLPRRQPTSPPVGARSRSTPPTTARSPSLAAHHRPHPRRPARDFTLAVTPHLRHRHSQPANRRHHRQHNLRMEVPRPLQPCPAAPPPEPCTGLPAGTYTVYAHYAGDATYGGSNSAPITVTISARELSPHCEALTCSPPMEPSPPQPPSCTARTSTSTPR